jgi:hypothetical protein
MDRSSANAPHVTKSAKLTAHANSNPKLDLLLPSCSAAVLSSQTPRRLVDCPSAPMEIYRLLRPSVQSAPRRKLALVLAIATLHARC